jgi:hypothetical protein
MKCTLVNKVPTEHANMKDPRLGEIFMNCPLFNGKQICFWCCLHIADLARPLTRETAQDTHPEYGCVTATTERDWDSLWQTCSKCSNR